MSALVAAQILINFSIQWYVVSRIGVAAETDALFAGLTLPQILTSVGVETLTLVLVPLLSTLPAARLPQYSWPLFIQVGIVSGIIASILYVITPLAVPLIVHGFSADAKALTISLARIQILTFPGAACFAVVSAVCQARHRFTLPLATSVFCAVVGFVVLGWKLGSVGTTLAAWVQVLIVCGPVLLLLPVLGSFQGLIFDPSLLMQSWRRMRPLALGSAYFRSTLLLDRFLTSFLAPGSVVLVSLPQQVHSALTRMANQGVVTPVVPELSRCAHNSDWLRFRALVRKKSIEMAIINAMMLGAVLIGWASMPVMMPTLTGRALLGHLTPETIDRLLIVFVLSSGLLLFSGLIHTLTSSFYAAGITHTPAKVGAVVYTIGGCMKVAGFFWGGLTGIALALSAQTFLHFIVLHYLFRRAVARHSSYVASVPVAS